MNWVPLMYAYNPLLVIIFTLFEPYSTLYCHIYLHMIQTKSQFSHNYLYLSIIYPYVLFKYPPNSHIYPVLAISPLILNIHNYWTMLKFYFSYICLYARIVYPYIVCISLISHQHFCGRNPSWLIWFYHIMICVLADIHFIYYYIFQTWFLNLYFN